MTTTTMSDQLRVDGRSKLCRFEPLVGVDPTASGFVNRCSIR
jgi:hypothetical protein